MEKDGRLLKKASAIRIPPRRVATRAGVCEGGGGGGVASLLDAKIGAICDVTGHIHVSPEVSPVPPRPPVETVPGDRWPCLTPIGFKQTCSGPPGGGGVKFTPLVLTSTRVSALILPAVFSSSSQLGNIGNWIQGFLSARQAPRQPSVVLLCPLALPVSPPHPPKDYF